jgi:hypothetical protein
MQPKPRIPSVFELSLGDYSTSGASICCNQYGTKFAVTIGPVTGATMTALDAVTQRHGMISLHSYDRPLLLDLVSLERKEPNNVRIVGRMFGQNTSDTVRGKAPVSHDHPERSS